MRVVYSLNSRLHCHWAMLGAFKCTGRCCNRRSIISSLTARLRVVAQDPDRTDKHTRGDTPPIKAQVVASLAALINTFPERFLQADSQNAVRTKPCLSGSPKVRQAGTPRYLTWTWRRSSRSSPGSGCHARGMGPRPPPYHFRTTPAWLMYDLQAKMSYAAECRTKLGSTKIFLLSGVIGKRSIRPRLGKPQTGAANEEWVVCSFLFLQVV
jgi:hypothetical protein